VIMVMNPPRTLPGFHFFVWCFFATKHGTFFYIAHNIVSSRVSLSSVQVIGIIQALVCTFCVFPSKGTLYEYCVF